MSKYIKLWEWISENGTDNFQMTFDEVEHIAGCPMDHSFLNYKKELIAFGYEVTKISMKEKWVSFTTVDSE